MRKGKSGHRKPRCVSAITEGCAAGHKGSDAGYEKLLAMNEYGVLNNRKRAWIALIHAVVFLGVAFHGFVSPKGGILRGGGAARRLCADWHLPGGGDDTDVAGRHFTLLPGANLLRVLRRRARRLGCCARCLGITPIPVAQYMRVIMLSSAIVVGALILRSFSRPMPENALSERTLLSLPVEIKRRGYASRLSCRSKLIAMMLRSSRFLLSFSRWAA